MATYAELLDLSQNMDRIRNRVLFDAMSPIGKFDIDSFAEHVPRGISEVNDVFYRSQDPTLPGILDFEKDGFTEPEDHRDIVSAHYALCHLDEVMPYLQQANDALTPEQLNDDRYSFYALRAGAEFLAGKDSLTEEQMKYLTTEAFLKDFGCGGAKHYEYDVCDARWMFRSEPDVDKVRRMQNLPYEIKFACQLHDIRVDDPVVPILEKAETSDGVYELASAYDTRNVSLENLQLISDCTHMLSEAAKNPDVNKKVLFEFDGFGVKEQDYIDRLSHEYEPGYINSYCELLGEPEFQANPEKLKELTQEFITNGGDHRWISEYYDEKQAERQNTQQSAFKPTGNVAKFMSEDEELNEMAYESALSDFQGYH